MLTKSLRRAIETEAKKDARGFVEEFGEALDPASTDWDGEAWGSAESRRAAAEADCENEAWEVYSAALVSETRRLAR